MTSGLTPSTCDPRKEERYGIYYQAKEKLFRCLQLCGRKRRNQTEMGNLAYPQGGLKAQGGNRKSAAHGNFSPAKQSDDHRVPL